MARVVLICSLVMGWSATHAMSAPAARQRVVLADPDPELRHAMEQVLAPWHLEIVIEGPPPASTAMAQERADADTARFVVWRDGDQLVVYDRELGSTEQRASQSGVLDPPTAAAAALTIKTMMRLPPPPAEASSSPALGATEAGVELRIQAGVAMRVTQGLDTYIAARFGGVAELRPWAASGWRFGLAGEGGPARSVSGASFKGTWRDWAIFSIASWTYIHDAWEFEPHAGAGIRRSTLDGAVMTDVYRKADTLLTARGGLWVRWRIAYWSFGAALDVDGNFSTPTYNKTGTSATFFQVPGVGVELGAVVTVDL